MTSEYSEGTCVGSKLSIIIIFNFKSANRKYDNTLLLSTVGGPHSADFLHKLKGSSRYKIKALNWLNGTLNIHHSTWLMTRLHQMQSNEANYNHLNDKLDWLKSSSIPAAWVNTNIISHGENKIREKKVDSASIRQKHVPNIKRMLILINRECVCV